MRRCEGELTFAELRGATLIVVAHRLNTVLNLCVWTRPTRLTLPSDRIFVLGSGQLLESGTPAELLARPDSALSSLARAHGHETDLALRQLARGSI